MTVYLLHLDQPMPRGFSPSGKALTCQHYLGSTRYLEARLEHHANGTGANLLRVAKERGITWQLARTWEGGRTEERKLKNRKDAPSLCPICNPSLKEQPNVNHE